jgi:nucleotide-binding universal stress UspA family protein
MHREIVVPLDGSARSESALTPAAMLARREGAPLRLLSVVSAADQVAPRAAYLRNEARVVSAADTAVTVLVGNRPAATISEAVGDGADAVVCMATHAHTGLGRLAFGSVAEEVVRASRAPVLLVGPHSGRDAPLQFKHLIVAIDGSAISESILPAAIAWARADGMRLILANALPIDAEMQLRGVDVQQGTYAAGLAAGLRAGVGAVGVEVDWDVLHGRDPARAIVEFAASFEGPVIALATHGRTGLSRLGGSVAMTVVRNSPCPVLVVYPSCDQRAGADAGASLSQQASVPFQVET